MVPKSMTNLKLNLLSSDINIWFSFSTPSNQMLSTHDITAAELAWKQYQSIARRYLSAQQSDVEVTE